MAQEKPRDPVPGSRPKTQNLKQRPERWRESHTAFVLVAPALAVLALLFFYPLAIVVVDSFTSPDGLTLSHYVRFFTNPNSWRALSNTIQIAVLSTVACIAISIPFALLLRRSQRYRTLMRTLVSIPLMIPVLISAYALLLFFAQNGLFNYLIVELLHLAPERLQISASLFGVVLACVWRFFPFIALVVAAALESADRSLEEAAAIMGANSLRVLRDIMLPLLVPSILTSSVLVFVSTFGTFSIPLIMGRGRDVLSIMAYRYYAVFFDTDSSSTIAVVMAAVQFVLLSLYLKPLRRPVV